ncbi:MAG: hypothetical protein IT285_05660 [Bdellovibrionales bacterium]|nr:hypothetical protein [Bdellovibrionales bacterium]
MKLAPPGLWTLLIAAAASGLPVPVAGADPALLTAEEIRAAALAEISDDPAQWPIAADADSFQPLLSAPIWKVPAPEIPLPTQLSNNNVSIEFHEGRVFMAWRTSLVHFASEHTRIHVVSSADGGASWDTEFTAAPGRDAREPLLWSHAGVLRLMYFEAGTTLTAFEPHRVLLSRRLAQAQWSEPEAALEPGEIPWDLRVRSGKAWLSSYVGAHYAVGGKGGLNARVRSAADGETWEPLPGAREDGVVYQGGVSEVSFELAEDGAVMGLGRNEDGDDTGFGSLVFHSFAETPGLWTHPARSDPERYDSPRMFRHGDAFYAVARRDVGGPFDKGWRFLPFALRRLILWKNFWTRPKRTALYRIFPIEGRAQHLMDLPSAGDTAFPAIRRLGRDEFLIANYTSPLDQPWITWRKGQVSGKGTQIYWIKLTFMPR